MESVQRYYTNKIPTCTFLPYNRRLQILNLDSLLKRRLVADLILVFSILNGSMNTSLLPYLTLAPPSVTRGHDLRITRPIFNLVASDQNFISRICPIWNKLPVSILSARSKSCFKKNLFKLCNDPYRYWLRKSVYVFLILVLFYWLSDSYRTVSYSYYKQSYIDILSFLVL